MASQRVLPDELPLGHSETCDHAHTKLFLKNASLLERLSVSKFPYRHPVLYGSLLELRSFLHRIQSLRKQGDIRPAEIGLVYQQSPVRGYLVRNMRSQARTQGIRKLLCDSPWLTTEDYRLFLAGWESAEEWRARVGSAENSEYSQDLDSSSSSATGNLTPPIVVQQSTKHDRSNPQPSLE